MVQHVHVDREARLQLTLAEQAGHEHVRLDRARFRREDDADVLGGFIHSIFEHRGLLGLDQLGEALHQFGFLHLVGDLGDDDPPHATAEVFPGPPGLAADTATARRIDLAQAFLGLDDHATCWKVRSSDDLEQVVHRRLRMIEQVDRRVDALGRIVRRDRRRHADRDAGRAIDQKVRKTGRENHRLLVRAVIGLTEIDSVVVEAFEQQHRRRGEFCFGVAKCSGRISIDVAEVALSIDQRRARRKVLRQTHHGVIDRLVAVRVILADDFADHGGRLAMATRRVQAQLAHRVENATVDRLQAIARIRQRTGGDRRQSIGKVALRQRLVDRFLDDVAAIVGRIDRGVLGHASLVCIARISRGRVALPAQAGQSIRRSS